VVTDFACILLLSKRSSRDNSADFVILNFGYCDLFDICDLLFDIL